jgi:hypothetical protein
MKAEVANEINRIDGPYKCVEAADALAESDESDNCCWMLPQFRVLIDGESD